jgi:hypothetical protein
MEIKISRKNRILMEMNVKDPSEIEEISVNVNDDNNEREDFYHKYNVLKAMQAGKPMSREELEAEIEERLQWMRENSVSDNSVNDDCDFFASFFYKPRPGDNIPKTVQDLKRGKKVNIPR